MGRTALPRSFHRFLATGLFAAFVAGGCGSDFPINVSTRHITVSLLPGNIGTPTDRLPLTFLEPFPIKVRVEAHDAKGEVDTDFNGYVRLSARPGSVLEVQAPGADGRNVLLTNGVAEEVTAMVAAAYGDARIWAEDIGYVPVDVNRQPPPQCADGIDNDGDGHIDAPTDPGCAFANDDTEEGGSFVVGTSEPVYFINPRLADVRGVQSGGLETPFRAEQVSVDTGYRNDTRQFEFSTVVTRIASNGFYATDIDDKRGYGSLYSFTFSAPQQLRICDRLKTFTGTATEFFGMTQLSSPTWTVELWNPNKRPCLIPDPRTLSMAEAIDVPTLFKYEAALVRVEAVGTVEMHIAKNFGPRLVPKIDGAYVPQPQNPAGTVESERLAASNCDLDRNGKVDFSPGTEEAACSSACDADAECSEFSNFVAQSNFKLVLHDSGNGRFAKMQANGSTSPTFDPVLTAGSPLRSFTGTLAYFSGGQQFTIESRCDDDIVIPLDGTPIPSDRACVRPRTEADNNEASQ